MADLSRPPIPEPVGTQNLAVLLRDAFLAIDAVSGRRVAEAYPDLRPAFSPIAQHVDDEGTRITELARRTGLTKPSIVYLVDELERLGYAERVPDPQDGRAKLVRPTERGKAAVELGREAIREIESEWSVFLGAEELERLRATLLKLHEALWPRADRQPAA